MLIKENYPEILPYSRLIIFFRINSSSRRLSKMKYLHPLTHPLHQCPRLSYIYPFPIMSTYYKYFPYLNAESFLKSIFTCLPLIQNHEKSSDSKKAEKKYSIPYYLNYPSLSPHTSIIAKFIDVELYVSSVKSVKVA